jgi:hypothetical protein
MGAGILFFTFYMEKESSTLNQVKNWLFPGAVTIIGIFAGMMLNDIKSDLAEVKSDIKVLMAQSNVDKTRIDNLERQVFKTSTASYPLQPINDEEPKANQYAVLTNNKLTKYGF